MVHEDEDLTYLDVTATLPDRDRAIDLGQQFNQIGIYDLLRGQEISTGGTGEPLPDLPPESDRLPRPVR
jgi:hypothetical protein